MEIFTDPRDGKIYNIVVIGEQTWMAQNLDYCGEDGNLGKWYVNDPEYGTKYGRLYNWFEAKMAVPLGWHLPINKDWQILVDFVGGEKVAGNRLRTKGGWINSFHKGTDKYGFSAMPGGIHDTDNTFYLEKANGYWWAATGNGSKKAWSWSINYLYSHIYKSTRSKETRFSVRCVKS